MTDESASLHDQVCQLKIHLLGISPMIWWRLLVTSETTIAQLHHILQIAMGWENFHLRERKKVWAPCRQTALILVRGGC